MAAVLCGCLKDDLVECGPIKCPTDKVCDGHGGCAFSAQLTSCAAQPDGEPCSYPGVARGECNQQLCVPVGCGNGALTSDEVCDDGNTINGDGCSADCRSNEICGNGIHDVAAGEQCDGGDTCRPDCTTRLCGDGIVEPPLEACDDGDANSDTLPDACRRNCQPARCGDDTLDTGEICDDGNAQGGDGCAADCRSNEMCGNGVIDAGEQCDAGTGNADAADACRTDCKLPRCGDGIVDALEACDHGEDNSDHDPGACRTNCQLPRCGDAVVDPGEVCDDGNNVSGDGCAANCSSREQCGDGVLNLEADESCDCGDGTTTPGPGCNGQPNATSPLSPCRPDCTLRRCGDGVLDAPEQCELTAGGPIFGGATCTDLGFYGGTLGCTPFCTLDTQACIGKCGDDQLAPQEQCDGTNLGANDSCQDFGFYSGTVSCTPFCTWNSSACAQRCGDGIVNGPEACDTFSFGEGQTCLTAGYYTGQLTCSPDCSFLIYSGCAGRCGDSIINGTGTFMEVCDKDNLDGASCETIPPREGELPYVGDGLRCKEGCDAFDPSECARCGDDRCERELGEDCGNCPADCADDRCEPERGESCSFCAVDCPCERCGDSICDDEERGICPADCPEEG